MTEELRVVRIQKDTVFRMLFREKKELLDSELFQEMHLVNFSLHLCNSMKQGYFYFGIHIFGIFSSLWKYLIYRHTYS